MAPAAGPGQVRQPLGREEAEQEVDRPGERGAHDGGAAVLPAQVVRPGEHRPQPPRRDLAGEVDHDLAVVAVGGGMHQGHRRAGRHRRGHGLGELPGGVARPLGAGELRRP